VLSATLNINGLRAFQKKSLEDQNADKNSGFPANVNFRITA